MPTLCLYGEFRRFRPTHLVDRFIAWASKDGPAHTVSTFNGVHLFNRYAPFWGEEWLGENRPPWWRPFNILVHNWQNGEAEAFHDHPRWSITICLRGKIIERTPWGERLLTPGSVVVRSRKFIHAFALPEDAGDVWTLFIVGRRNHLQNSYEITRKTAKQCGLPVVAEAPTHLATPSNDTALTGTVANDDGVA